MKVYIIAHCFSRFGEWTKRGVKEFPDDEDPLIIASVLVHAMYFNAVDAQRQYEEYLSHHDDPDRKPFFLYEIENMKFEKSEERIVSLEFLRSEEGMDLIGEEWNAGLGLTPEAAMKAYIRSEPGENDAEWEDMDAVKSNEGEDDTEES